METKTSTPFTFRQKEFARLYAQGIPAAQAARSAGYAASTCETNAARLLSHPRIARFIEKSRSKRCIVTTDDIELCVSRLREIIKSDMDPDRIIKATRQMARFLQAQIRDGISSFEDNDNFDDTICSSKPDTLPDNSADTKKRQRAGSKVKDESSFSTDEVDQLPSGQVAFDLQIGKLKAEVTKEPEHITVNFVVEGDHQNNNNNSDHEK